MERNKNKSGDLVSGALVSVVIPSYNRGSVLKRAIDSVLEQSYQNIECIVVDDNSNDDTRDVIDDYDDKRLQYIRLDENHGACGARNIGVENARGDYIAFQDSDDRWDRLKMEKQLNYMKDTGVDMCFCAFKKSMDGKETIFPELGYELPSDVAKELLKGNLVSTQTILAKRKVFEEIKFDEKLPRFQDWDIAIRIASKYKVGYLGEPLVNIFVQDDSITKNPEKGIRALSMIESKYHDIIYGDPEIVKGFLKYSCFLHIGFGRGLKESAGKYLKNCGFNFKMFVFYLVGCLHMEKLVRRLI